MANILGVNSMENRNIGAGISNYKPESFKGAKENDNNLLNR
jgi:hypothetical protein